MATQLGRHAYVAVRPVDAPSLASPEYRRNAGQRATHRWTPADFHRDASALQEELNADMRAEARDAALDGADDDWRVELP